MNTTTKAIKHIRVEIHDCCQNEMDEIIEGNLANYIFNSTYDDIRSTILDNVWSSLRTEIMKNAEV